MPGSDSFLIDPSKSHLHADTKSPYISGFSSRTGSEVSLHRVKNLPGYTTPVFKGKEEQRAKVQIDVAAKVGHRFFFFETDTDVQVRDSFLASSLPMKSIGFTLTSA